MAIRWRCLSKNWSLFRARFNKDSAMCLHKPTRVVWFLLLASYEGADGLACDYLCWCSEEDHQLSRSLSYFVRMRAENSGIEATTVRLTTTINSVILTFQRHLRLEVSVGLHHQPELLAILVVL